MSLLKAIRAQLGLSVTPANNFTLDASADNGTGRIYQGDAGTPVRDIMTWGATGKPDFPQLARSFGANGSNGYCTLPSGLIIQWGRFTNSATPNSSGTITFPIPFPTACMHIVGTSFGTSSGIPMFGTTTTTTSQSFANIASMVTQWIAIGH